MVNLEVYSHPKLTDPYDLGPFRRALQTGVVPESLEPNGLFTAQNGQMFWSFRLLHCTPQSHYIEADKKGLLVQDMTKTYSKIAKIPLGHLRLAYLREFLYVGNLGFLLGENQDMLDELHIANLPEAEGSDWWNHSIQVRVDPKHRFQWVDLIGLWGYCLQEKEGENNLVVISGDYQILPSGFKIIKVANHNFLN